VRYGEYKDYDGIRFPTQTEIERPQEEYDITLNILKLDLNKPLSDDQFDLQVPAGAEVVHLASRPARRTVPTEAIQDKTLAVSQGPWAPAVRALLHSQQSPNWLCQAPTTNDRLMMNKMIVGNLVHRPLRSLISIVAIALEVTLIC